MKKLFTIIGLASVVALAHGQGYIVTQGGSANITTNTSSYYSQGVGNPISGKTATAVNGFYYALLVSSTPVAGVSSPTGANWSAVTQFNGSALAMNNYTVLAGGITGSGTSAGVQVNLAAGTAYNVELVGWSANLGTTWAQVSAQLATGNWTASGFFGNTLVGTITPFATSGAGDPSVIPNTFSNGSLTLYSVTPAPEPGTMALAGLGIAGLLALRRKK